MPSKIIAAVEAGGTKMICAVADGEGQVLEQARVSTSEPDTVFETMRQFYREMVSAYGPIDCGGVASFGPLDLDRGSPFYGRLTTTPKQGWAGVDVLGRIQEIFDAPTLIDTDVNCAALAELRHGAGRGLQRLAYMTVGTGIGVGITGLADAEQETGHAEVGHIRVSRAPGDDFEGICPSHRDCIEGLACGPAIAERWRQSAEKLADDHVGWTYEAHYLAAICVNLTYIARPERIIVGGGVLERASLYPAIRARFAELTAGYALDRHSSDPETFICAPVLRNPSPGLVGAIELASGAAAHVSI